MWICFLFRFIRYLGRRPLLLNWCLLSFLGLLASLLGGFFLRMNRLRSLMLLRWLLGGGLLPWNHLSCLVVLLLLDLIWLQWLLLIIVWIFISVRVGVVPQEFVLVVVFAFVTNLVNVWLFLVLGSSRLVNPVVIVSFSVLLHRSSCSFLGFQVSLGPPTWVYIIV